MPPDTEFTLTEAAVKQLAAANRFTSRFSRENVNRTDGPLSPQPYTPATVVWPVKATGIPPGGSPELSSLYVGTVYQPNPTGAPTWLELPCWVRSVPGVTLAVGDTGMARLVGFLPANAPYDAMPIYALVPSGGSVGGNCTGCGWLAGMGPIRCLRVSVNGVATSLYLSTANGGVSWANGTDLLTICGRDFSVTVAQQDAGPPKLTLAETGSAGVTVYGRWNCCGCAFAKWDYNLQEICPDEDDTGDPCTNVVEVRVDNAACPAPGANCCEAVPAGLGDLYTRSLPFDTITTEVWSWAVTAGNYTLTVTKTDVIVAQVDAQTGPACDDITTTLLVAQPVGVYPLVIASDGTLCVSVLTHSDLTGSPNYTIELTSP